MVYVESMHLILSFPLPILSGNLNGTSYLIALIIGQLFGNSCENVEQM
jgi:hypothetical protein